MGATSSAGLKSISEHHVSPSDDDDWDLLVSLFQASPPAAGILNGGAAHSQYKDRLPSMWAVQTVFAGSVGFEVREVLWSLEDLAFKIILDIECMRSVVGVKWANTLLARWQREGRWFAVESEAESFKFGDGAVLVSKFRIHFVGSFAGQPVIYGFSVVEGNEGNCPPLFSRSGCSQIGAVIDCDDHSLGAKRLKVRGYGVGRDTGHYTMRVDDECEPACANLPREFRLPASTDIMPVNPEILRPSASVEPSSFVLWVRMSEVNPPLCKICKQVGHRTRDCPQIALDSYASKVKPELSMQVILHTQHIPTKQSYTHTHCKHSSVFHCWTQVSS